jgi:putative phosphoesterase
MRLALVSDIHANFDALAVVADLLEGADRVVCLGDCVGYYRQVNEVLDYMRSIEPVCVLGNHDLFALTKCPPSANQAVRSGVEHAAATMTRQNRAWLESLPVIWAGRLDNIVLLAVHGSPWRPLDDYLYADDARLRGLSEFEVDVVALGQTHRGFVSKGTRPQVVNPGSVGQPRDLPGTASVALIDTADLDSLLVRRTLDLAGAPGRTDSQDGGQE